MSARSKHSKDNNSYGIAWIIAAIAFAWFAFFRPPILQDSDGLWHMAAGDEIRELGAVPEYDSWTVHAGTFTWYNISWLFDAALSFVSNYAGEKAAFLCLMLLAASTVYIVSLHIQKKQVSVEANIAISLCLILGLTNFITSRPQLITYLLLALWHYQLWSFQQGKKSALLILPLSMVIWVNCHGGFFLGFGVLGIYGIYALYIRDLDKIKSLIAVGFACLIAAFINPFGGEIIEGVMRTMKSSMSPYTQEWLPTQIMVHFTVTTYFLVFILVSDFKNKTISPVDHLLCLSMLILGLTSIRHFPLFMIVAAPYMAQNVMRFNHPIRKELSVFCSETGRCAMIAIFSITLVSTALHLPLTSRFFISGMGSEPLLRYMREDTEWVIAHYPNERFYNNFNIGGELNYISRGRIKHFVDGRVETAIPPEAMNDHVKFANLQTMSFKELADKYKLKGAILSISNNKSEAQIRAEGWEEVYKGKALKLFLLSGEKN